MLEWVNVMVAAVIAGVVFTLLIVFVCRCCCSKKRTEMAVSRTGSLQDGIARLHQASVHQQIIDHLDSRRRGNNNYYKFRRGTGVSAKPLFSWSDHPSLVTDAVENGWSRFAFTKYMLLSSSTKSTILGLCAAGDNGRETEAEMGWEVCQGSADFMQKIRMNSGLKKIILTSPSSMAASSVIRTALPLPGPPLLETCSFPQEAYFEITILSHGNNNESIGGKFKEGDRMKLIQENSNEISISDSLIHVTSSHGNNNKLEELKISVKDDGGKVEVVMLSLGLTGGGSLPLKLPGSYPGTIGFNSNGSVYLDGIKLVFESENGEWGRADKVIGCGFDPRKKIVFFTVDSELVHVIHCKSEEFGTPLYPTLAANGDVTVLVNFGQSVFEYAPANANRTPNPCFIGPLVDSPAAALGYEDSTELFSMGRIDSQWLNRSTTKASCNNGSNHSKADDFDEESDADLFEIVLDSSGRSPNSVL